MLWKRLSRVIKVYRIPTGIANIYSQKAAEGLVWAGPQPFREVFHVLAQQKECEILEGHLLPDHVHMGITIPPKHPVASVIGFFKGKSAIAVAREFGGKERKFTGEHLWARGYAVSTTSASKRKRMDQRTSFEIKELRRAFA